ncbi:hypothetical protein J5N97_030299 [Dioscorea zingiberensis]|uniref:Mitochondrial glycoprotein n=1 Tax=Dioscorea zingiberensis TaxID=325984 RepID=A0A9D5BXP8_9LILI|nr:hypothetical protein J5N97_030299 [Dioscorea zingiberensis]
MVFYAALRRASLAAVSASIRALGNRQMVQSSARFELLPLSSIFTRRHAGGCPSSHPLARFSSLAEEKPASDADLVKVIDSEIICAEESDDHDRVEEIPQGFPFEIQDENGMNVITLKRTYQTESIEVSVSMPCLVTGEEPENAGGGDNDDEDYEKPGQSSLPLTVVITKEGGPILEFYCTAYPDEVVIDSMSVGENEQTGEEALAYEGPDFNDLDENLQKAFHKYLELRGICALNTNFLHEYMINKDSREYLLWLKDLKKFVEK